MASAPWSRPAAAATLAVSAKAFAVEMGSRWSQAGSSNKEGIGSMSTTQANRQAQHRPRAQRAATWLLITAAAMMLVPSSAVGAGGDVDPQEPEDHGEQAAVGEQEEQPADEQGFDPEVSFPGQYRINAYSVDNDREEEGRQTAARLRIRQSIDIRFDERFKTHLQFQLNHTTDNQGLSDNSVKIRHAAINYETRKGARFQAGIVPLGDRFGDTQFSSDWDYNPLALEILWPTGPGSFRFFGGNLDEGSEFAPEDDIVHWQGEYEWPLDSSSWLVFSGTWIELPDAEGERQSYGGLGVSGKWSLSESWSLRSFLAASTLDGTVLGLEEDANGVGAKVEMVGSLGRNELGFQATWAQGGEQGDGFLPIMSLIGFNGYWGYTGILTVQGPTDTGFDGDSVNFSNNGYGLASAQVRWTAPLAERFNLWLAAGWFGGSQAENRSGTVGIDGLLMGTIQLHKFLVLDLGFAMARLEDSVSGYFQGAGGEFNQLEGVGRDKMALFARLQAEF